ncbi:MAG: XdhC family protein [Acidiferrobacterales bacterium]
MKRETLKELLAARHAKKPVALVTFLASGAQVLVYPQHSVPTGALDAALFDTAQRALKEDRSGNIESAAGKVFVHVCLPPRRLFIIGAVHIAQVLASMARLAGYEVVVIDPRRAFATEARFPHVQMITEWPDRALARVVPDRHSAIVALTHDPKLDEPALKAALQSEAFYIGALGSKQTQAARRERLTRSGFDANALSRIHGPAGLSLGAKTPAEIAIAIMAELTRVLRQGNKTQGRDAK